MSGKNESARPEAGEADVVVRIRKAVRKFRDCESEIVLLGQKEEELRVEVTGLEEETDMNDKTAVEILNVRRLALSCYPGTVRRVEKQMAELRRKISEDVPILKECIISDARKKYDSILSKATKAFMAFFGNEDSARVAANAAPLVRAASGRFKNAETADIFIEDAVDAAEKFLALLSDPETAT